MGFLLDSGADTIPRWPLAGLRIYGGLVFCGASLAELMGRQAWPVPPNAALDPPAVLVLELLVGVALVLGVVSRAAALIGLALMAGRLIAGGLKPADLVSPGPNTAITILLLTVMLGRAGRVWGVDRLLAARWPTNPLW